MKDKIDELARKYFDNIHYRAAFKKGFKVAKATRPTVTEGEIKELRHFRDTVIGLWATDRPDLVDDPQKIMFQIKE